MRYHIIGFDGNEYGPVSAEEVREWFHAHRLMADSSVRREKSLDWATLKDLPELADLTEDANSQPAFRRREQSVRRTALLSLILAVVAIFLPVLGTGLAVLAFLKGRQAFLMFPPTLRRQTTGLGLARIGIVVAWLALVVNPVISAIFAVHPTLIRWENQKTATACYRNLFQIEVVKEQYVSENRLSPGSTIPRGMRSLIPYLHPAPICPAAGQYSANPVGTAPACSIHDSRPTAFKP